MQKKKIYSKVDTRGILFIDCSECECGGNGNNTEKCSSGWHIKKGNIWGCFCGEPMEKIKSQLVN